MAFTNGQLLQVTDRSDDKYLFMLGAPYQIPDGTLANLFGPNWTSLVTVVPTLGDDLPGPTFTDGASLIKSDDPTDESIFLYTWGIAFGIGSPDILREYHFDVVTPYTIPATVIHAMPQGFHILS